MKYAALLVLLLFVLLFGCLQPQQSINSTDNLTNDSIINHEGLNTALGADWETKYPDLAARIKAREQDSISIRGDSLPDVVFAKLPQYPKDFDDIQLLVYIGRITDMSKISEAYFKQPEFYPQFGSQGVPLYQHPTEGRWGAFGYGTYPSETLVQSPRNAQWNVSFFMHASWVVETYQGIGFKVIYPATSSLLLNNFENGNKTIIQDPNEVSQYFDVTVTPRSMLLAPAFPVFEYDWTQRVVVNVKAKNVPPGRYAIGLDVGSPDEEHAQEWLWKYKTRYSGMAGTTGIGMPFYTIFIEIT